MAVSVTMPIMVHVTAAVSTTAAAVRMLLVTAAVVMTGTCGDSHGTEGQTGSHRNTAVESFVIVSSYVCAAVARLYLTTRPTRHGKLRIERKYL